MPNLDLIDCIDVTDRYTAVMLPTLLYIYKHDCSLSKTLASRATASRSLLRALVAKLARAIEEVIGVSAC